MRAINMSLNFTRHDRTALKKLYKNAVENKQYVITFQGQELLTEHTKYLLKYLNEQTFV